MADQKDEKPVPASMGKVQRVDFVAQNPVQQADAGETLSDEEQANVDKGLNKDGTAKTEGDNLSETEKANIAAGLNKDGTPKDENLTDAEKENLAKGLNKDGSQKTPKLTAAEQANVDKGLNPDGSAKAQLTDDDKLNNLAKGLNEDGSARTTPLSKEEIEKLHKREFPTQTELTPEEKTKQEQAFEKRMLDWFVEKGGTVDTFAAMKFVATADLTELSEKELEKELTEAGFDEEQKKMIRAERFYQLDDEEIATLTDEKEKALAIKKKEFGSAKLKGLAEGKQKLAVGFFDTIKKALADQDAEIVEEKELAQKVDSHFKTIPEKITLQMGKTTDNVDIAPLDLPISADIVTEVREFLKDTAKRNNFLNTEDGTLNIAALSEILLENKVLKAGLNTAYLKGVTDNTAVFEETFPVRDANGVGLGSLQGGSGQGKVKAKMASFGKATRVNVSAPTT